MWIRDADKTSIESAGKKKDRLVSIRTSILVEMVYHVAIGNNSHLHLQRNVLFYLEVLQG